MRPFPKTFRLTRLPDASRFRISAHVAEMDGSAFGDGGTRTELGDDATFRFDTTMISGPPRGAFR